MPSQVPWEEGFPRLFPLLEPAYVPWLAACPSVFKAGHLDLSNLSPTWKLLCPSDQELGAAQLFKGIPHSSKVRFRPLSFYERLTYQKKSEEDFPFYEKKGEKQNNLQCLFCREHGSSEWPSRAPSGDSTRHPSVTSASSHQGSGLCEHLSFISIYFVLPLARYVLRYHQCL